jgi:hypothetical protein
MKHKIGYPPSLFALVFVFLLTGCAGIPRSLKPEQIALVNRTDVRAYLPNRGIQAQYIQSSYGAGGGLIGALIDAGVSSAHENKANERVQRLRNLVADLDIAAMHLQALSNKVSSIPWLKVQSFASFESSVRSLNAEDVTSGAVMNLGSDFILSQDCKVFILSTGVGFFMPGHHKKPAAANIIAYHSAEVGKFDGDKAIDLWTTNGATAFRQTVAESVEQNANLVSHALELMGNASSSIQKPAKVKAKLMHAAGDFGIPFGKVTLKGKVLEETPDRLVFYANANGNLYSFPRQEVDVEYLPTK